jgi:transcription elongation factor Elf1
MNITAEQKYMDNGGNECPHCGGTDISGCGFESDGTHAWREVECENCGKEWKELFSMTGVEL